MVTYHPVNVQCNVKLIYSITCILQNHYILEGFLSKFIFATTEILIKF